MYILNISPLSNLEILKNNDYIQLNLTKDKKICYICDKNYGIVS